MLKNQHVIHAYSCCKCTLHLHQENSPLFEVAPRFPFLLRGMLSVDPTQANAHTHTYTHTQPYGAQIELKTLDLTVDTSTTEE